MRRTILLMIGIVTMLIKCDSEIKVTDEQLDYLGITDKDKLSAASKRALAWPKLGNDC